MRASVGASVPSPVNNPLDVTIARGFNTATLSGNGAGMLVKSWLTTRLACGCDTALGEPKAVNREPLAPANLSESIMHNDIQRGRLKILLLTGDDRDDMTAFSPLGAVPALFDPFGDQLFPSAARRRAKDEDEDEEEEEEEAAGDEAEEEEEEDLDFEDEDEDEVDEDEDEDLDDDLDDEDEEEEDEDEDEEEFEDSEDYDEDDEEFDDDED